VIPSGAQHPPLPQSPLSEIPTVSAAGMGALDRQAEVDFAITTLQLMEQAGQQMAAFVRWWLGGVREQPIAVVTGPGNNGADGLVAARYLHNWGGQVRAWIASPEERLHPLAAQQARTARAAGVPLERWRARARVGGGVVVDALLGIGLTRPPDGEIADAIRYLNQQGVRLALDLPSGTNAEGADFEPCILATATVTLGLPKAMSRTSRGRLFVADIGLPRALGQRLGKDWGNLFAASSIVELI